MSLLLDSSVLVRAVVASHPDHAVVDAWYTARLAETELLATTHALAETFKVVSGAYRAPHAECRRIVARLRRDLTLVALHPADYLSAIEMTMRAGRSGPTVYDALHVAGAVRAGATHVAACDLRSFPFLLPPAQLVNPLAP